MSSFVAAQGPGQQPDDHRLLGLAFSNYSTKKDLGAKWVEYTARPEIMKDADLRGRVPARMSLLD